MKTGNEKMDAILAAIAGGKTVYFLTMTRSVPVSLRDVAKWSKTGNPLFKWNDKHIWMGFGKRYDCIDYCGIRILG